jgi:hypothetical protein
MGVHLGSVRGGKGRKGREGKEGDEVSLELGPASPHPGFQVQTNNVSSVRPSPRQSESRANAACRAWVVSPSVQWSGMRAKTQIAAAHPQHAKPGSTTGASTRISHQDSAVGMAWHGMGRAGWLAGWVGWARLGGQGSRAAA